VPSRGGIDDCTPVVAVVRDWLTAHGLPITILTDDSGVVGLTCDITGGYPGPTWVLDACLDTGPRDAPRGGDGTDRRAAAVT
jgi:succinyl-diaminopimelate desuccinylase